MKDGTVASSFFKGNRKKLVEKMDNSSVLVVYGNPTYYYSTISQLPFRQDPDFYYLTGIDYPDCMLLIYKKDDLNFEEVLYIPEITDFKRQWDSGLLEKETAIELSAIGHVTCFPPVQKELLSQFSSYKIDFLYSYRPHRGVTLPGKDFHKSKSAFLGRLFPNVKKKSALELIHGLRVVKEDKEIDEIQKAVRITSDSLHYCLSNLSRFRNEKEFMDNLLHAFRENGGHGVAFDPIIANGKNATVLHYIQNSDVLVNNELILADIGARYGNYNADITRTFPYMSITSRQSLVFNSVYRVYNESLKEIKPGISIHDINQKVAGMIEEELLKLGLITQRQVNEQNPKNPAYRKYYMHSASHFLGLDVHDVGKRDLPLQENMVITLEPGIYIAAEGIGIRLENDLRITENGAEELSSCIPMHWEDLLDWSKS